MVCHWDLYNKWSVKINNWQPKLYIHFTYSMDSCLLRNSFLYNCWLSLHHMIFWYCSNLNYWTSQQLKFVYRGFNLGRGVLYSGGIWTKRLINWQHNEWLSFSWDARLRSLSVYMHPCSHTRPVDGEELVLIISLLSGGRASQVLIVINRSNCKQISWSLQIIT